MAEQRGHWQRTRSAAKFAFLAFMTQRQRAVLALLGVAIGVASVVTLVALGKGLERQAQNEFKAMGTQVMDVQLMDRELSFIKSRPSPTRPRSKPLTPGELLAALSAMPEVELVSAEVSLSCSGVADQYQQVSAVQPEMAAVLNLKLSSGRFIHALDAHEMWVVLGAQAAQKLAAQKQMVKPGETLILCGRPMRLAGVLAPDSLSGEVASMWLDDGMLVSIRAGQRIDSQAKTNHFVLRAKPDVAPAEFAPRLEAKLSELTGQSARVSTAMQALELRRKQSESTTRFLVALSSLSLLVGSLGILNVMLMTVLERRGEIGLRMAIGADDLDIGLQFLAESALLGLAGGAVGVALGLVAAWVVSMAANLPFVVSVNSLVLAFGISSLVGMVSGLYPALKAARLYPVEALRASR